MTLERTGRSMKNFEIMAGSYLAAAGGASIFFSCGSTFWPGIARNSPAVTTRSSAFRPLSITRSSPSSGPVRDLALLDDILAVHDQHIAAGLVAAERHVRHEQRVLLPVERHADAHEKSRQQRAVGIGQHAAHRERAGRLVERRRGVVELALVRKAGLGLQSDLDRQLPEIVGRHARAGGPLARIRSTSCSLTLKFT